MGQTTGTTLDPVGHEIGGLVATIAQTIIDGQGMTNEFSIQGVRGSNPTIHVSKDNVILGIGTARELIARYTNLAFDDSSYPDAPTAYEFHMRDNILIWRKEKALTSNPAQTFTIGVDAILDGMISMMPVYTDFHVTAKDRDNSYAHSDKDSVRRWGGRRFWGRDDSTSSFLDAAQSLAVRAVELFKHERRSFSIVTTKDVHMLHPGDIVAIYGVENYGLASGNYRISEIDIQLSPTAKARITVGDPKRTLTDYL